MRRNLIIALLALGLLAAPGAGAGPQNLPPQVTYEKTVQLTRHGPVVVHVVTAPKPGGALTLEPALSNGVVAGREPLTALQRRLLRSVTSLVGVNGDFSAADGRPEGVLMQGGVLAAGPSGKRSSLGIDAEGNLVTTRVRLVARWNGTGPRRPLAGVNQPPATSGVTLFTPAWGGGTPAASDTTEVVLSSLPPTTPNTELSGTVGQVKRGGGTRIPAGGAVLVGRGNQGRTLLAEAPAGTQVVIRLILNPAWGEVVNAIGGGPVLVRDGKAVFRSGESFSSRALGLRRARTAIGQRTNGKLLLVVADGGRPGYSVGLSNYELARTLVRLHAVTGYALGSGAPSVLASDGKLLSRPTRAGETGLADALLLVYRGPKTGR